MTFVAVRGPATAGSATSKESRLMVIGGVSLLMVFFAGLALVLPIGTEAPMVDEPIYATSAFEWASTGAIEISGLSAPNAVFDTIWGGMFARAFGQTYQALRLSTLVLTAISAPFMYWLCRNLGADRGVSLLGTAAYLLSPLVIVLSATFMTDAHFMALVVMSVAFYLHGLTTRGVGMSMLLAGSALGSLAFLSRPQALVIPAAAALVVALSPRETSKALRLVAVLTLPAVAFVAHAVWTSQVGEPFIREMSTQFLLERVVRDAAPFAGRLIFMASVYIGIIGLPLLPLLKIKKPTENARPFLAVSLGLGLAALYLVMLASGYDPTSRQTFWTAHGLGAVDRSSLGHRPEMWPGWVQAGLGLVAVISTYAWVMNATGRWNPPRRKRKSFLGLVGAGLTLGAVAASMTFHGDVFDRYLLPVIPLLLALVVATARPSRVRLALSATLVALVGAFGILGSYDALIAHDRVAAFAESSVEELGISPLQFEGGAAWSAQTFGVSDDGPEYILDRHGPFWVKFYAVETRPEYGVALEPLDGYEVLSSSEYPSILHVEPTRVYLIRGNADIGYFVDPDDF